MVKITPTSIIDTAQKVITHSSVGSKLSGEAFATREMEMIPKYLEVASLKGKDRFSSNEILQITKNFEDYKTNLSKTDLVKNLLSIGNEKGSPLTSEEFVGFLNVTSEMKPQEQMNVLNFLKTGKERIPSKWTKEEYEKSFSYDEFKKHYIETNKNLPIAKHIPDFLSEESIQNAYNIELENTIRIRSNPYYSAVIETKAVNPITYITKTPGKSFINAVAKSSDPENLFYVIEATGVNPITISTTENLLQLFKLSNNNKSLVSDISRLFYPSEIKQIAEKLTKLAKTDRPNPLTEYSERLFNTEKHIGVMNLNKKRQGILSDLGLEGEITLQPLIKHIDVFGRPDSKIIGGFERGKHR